MQWEPIISFSHFANFNNKFIVLFQDFRLFSEYLALWLRNGKDPILALIAKDLDLNTPIKKPGLYLLILNAADIVEGNINLNKELLIQKAILINSLKMNLLLLLLNNSLQSLIKNKQLRIILPNQLTNLFIFIKSLWLCTQTIDDVVEGSL